MEFAVLGPLQVSNERGPIDIRGVKERTLLAHLVACAGQMVTADELIDSLWGDAPPRTAAKSLQTYVLRLRNALEPDRHGAPRLILTEGSGYRLAVRPDAVDAARFAWLVDLGRRAYRERRLDAAAVTLREALALWRGRAYAGFEATRFGGGEARRLEELRLGAIEDRIAADLDLGRTHEAVAELESLVYEHPLRERLWYLLVLALYRSGRQADALATYSRARDRLIDELGVEPGDELREIHAAVLTQDEALLAPTAAPAVPTSLLPPPGPFVGRTNELNALHERWVRSVGGTPVMVVVRGPKGSGRSRLAAEFAVEIAEQGHRVEHFPDGTFPSQPAHVPTVTVVTGRSVRTDFPRPSGPRLTIVVDGPTASVPEEAEALDLEPLGPNDVRSILASYIDESDAEEVLPGVLRQTGALPGRVHDAGLDLARQRAAVQVRAAATRTGQMHAALGAARDDLRAGVTRFHDVLDQERAGQPGICPWKGLAAYDVGDAPWFAGRELLVAELLTRMVSAKLLAVVGASGSGKSSLVRAGLLASLRAGALPGSERWTQLVMRPGPHPLRELVRVTMQGANPDTDQVAELLQRMVYGEGTEGRTVLVVDQLEETWTLCPSPGERTAFLDALAEVVESDARCTVVFVVRADYVAELADQPLLAQMLADATVLVGEPSQAEIRRAVLHPAERANLELDIGLADALVTDASGEPGSLPLLSTALTELWEHRDGQRLTLSAYITAGGVRGAVARIAEKAYGDLEPADQAAARVLLLRLAGGGEANTVARRRVPLAELTALPDPRVRAVVDPLADARLLSLSADHVEVAHEALFREWPRLRAWLDEDAAGRAVQRRLAVAAAEWYADGREPTELWRGTRLAAGTDFAASHPDEITDVEHAFLEAGRGLQDAERRAAERRAATATRQNRRLRWLLGSLAVVLAVALTASVLAARAESKAQREALIATARELAAAAVANLEVDPERSVLLALEAVERARTLDSPVRWEAEEALHRAVMASRVVLTVPGIGGSTAWSPDGTVFVTEGPEHSGIIDLRDAETGETVRSWHGHNVDVNEVAFNHDGSMLATSGDDGVVRVWDPATGVELMSMQNSPDGVVWAPSFSAEGSLMTATWFNSRLNYGQVRLLDLDTGHTVTEVGDLDRPWKTALSPDGTRLVISSDYDQVASVLAVESSEEVFSLDGHGAPVGDAAWSPDGRWIATASADTTARIWDAETGRAVSVLSGHTGPLQFVAWSANSARVTTGSQDGTLKVWEISDDSAREIFTLPGTYYSGSFSPDGSRFVTGSDPPETVTIWDVSVRGEAEWATVPASADGFSGLDFAPDGGLVAYRDGGKLSVWDAESGQELQTIDRHGAYDFRVAVSPDGRLIATASVNDRDEDLWQPQFDPMARLVVMDMATGAELFIGPPSVVDVAWSPDGSLLATANAHGVVTIYDRDYTVVAALAEGPGWHLDAVRFSPDGRLVATTRIQGGRPDAITPRVRVWDWSTGDVVQTIDADTDVVAFDPAGSRLATGGWNGDVQIWDVHSGRLLGTLTGHTASIWSIEFSPDGAQLATGSLDGTIRLWHAAQAAPVLTLRGHDGWVRDVRFSPDGSKLASSSADGTIKVWALDLDDLIAIAEGKVTRTLTDEECRQFLHLEQCPQS